MANLPTRMTTRSNANMVAAGGAGQSCQQQQGARVPTTQQQRVPAPHGPTVTVTPPQGPRMPQQGHRMNPGVHPGHGSRLTGPHMQPMPGHPQHGPQSSSVNDNQGPAMHTLPGQVSGPASRTRSRLSISGEMGANTVTTMSGLSGRNMVSQSGQPMRNSSSNQLSAPGAGTLTQQQQQHQYFPLGENVAIETQTYHAWDAVGI